MKMTFQEIRIIATQCLDIKQDAIHNIPRLALYPTSYYDFVPNRQNRCEFLRHFMTVGFVNNFRTLGNMFFSSIYVTEGEMGPF